MGRYLIVESKQSSFMLDTDMYAYVLYILFIYTNLIGWLSAGLATVCHCLAKFPKEFPFSVTVYTYRCGCAYVLIYSYICTHKS